MCYISAYLEGIEKKSFKEEKLFEIGGTYEEKNLDRVDTVNKNIEKEITE